MNDSAVPEQKTVPILIFAPGLGNYAENTADRIAEVIAATVDRLDPTATYGTKADAKTVGAPGLRASKAVVTSDDKPLLQVFELDYKPLLDPPSGPGGPPVVPGAVRSAALATLALWKWFRALGRPAKGKRAKAQLLLGMAAAGSLILWALVSVYAALKAMGVDFLPGRGIFGADAAPVTFGISAAGLTITWAALRKSILAFAATAERCVRFVRNDGAVADTIAVSVDQAIDRLRANGWSGPVHLLGYSFGGLPVFETMYPRTTSLLSNKPVQTVKSMVTIGCPLDLVRLYHPKYLKMRTGRKDELEWVNVFNGADIFSSNLDDEDDSKGGEVQLLSPSGSSSTSFKATSERYLGEHLSVFRLLIIGKIHSGYWGQPGKASCFDRLVGMWISVDPPPPPPRRAAMPSTPANQTPQTLVDA